MILWTIWCGSAQLIRLMRILVPDGYQYDTENLCGYFTGGNLSVYLLVTGGLFLGGFWILLKYKEQTGKWIRRGLGILGGLLVAFVAAMMLYSYFVFRMEWNCRSFMTGCRGEMIPGEMGVE